MTTLPDPVVREHDGILVVRDDMIPGGTKARYLMGLFERYDEVVYGTPAQGGAQLALAYCARSLGKRTALFTAERKILHARTLEAKAVGARVFLVPHGRLNVVQARAKAYAAAHGAHLLPWGADVAEARDLIADAARKVWAAHGPFDQVWSAAGSATLSRGLQEGMPDCPAFFAVQVGAQIKNPGRATVIAHPLTFDDQSTAPCPFPSCGNYDRKAWDLCRHRSSGRVLFWNVVGPSPTGFAHK